MAYVIVATGESNSGFAGHNSDATVNELASRSEVQMWNVNTGVFENLDIGTNNNLDHALANPDHHSWELQLANDVASGLWSQSPMYYIQTGQGGSRISQWDAVGTYWTKWLARVTAAKSYFVSSGITPEWIVFLSLGINDAVAGTATATLESEMILWIDRIKVELPGCKIVITELTPSYPTYSVVMRSIADSQADVAFAYTQDLTLENVNHWDYDGLKILSTRMSRLAQYQLGIADGNVFTDFTSTMFPSLNQFGWTGSSPSTTGAISKTAIDWADGSYVSWLTPASGTADGIVVMLESTKDTDHTWGPAQTFLYAAYRQSTSVYGGMTYAGMMVRGTASDETRILRRGNDAILQVRTSGGSWATKHTAVGLFLGIASVYVHLINPATSASDTLTMSFLEVPAIGPTALTQPLAGFPYTQPRRIYGSFGGRDQVPDFMRGSLNIFPHLSGEITIGVHVSGDVWSNSVLAGRIEVNP